MSEYVASAGHAATPSESVHQATVHQATVHQATVQQGLPISVPVQPTGDARVDAALERLQELDQVPTSDQVEIYTDIHQRLTAALGDTAHAPEPQGAS